MDLGIKNVFCCKEYFSDISKHRQPGLVVARRSRSTELLYVGPG